MLVALEDGIDRLLAGGVVGGDLQELMRSARLLSSQLVDQGLAVSPAVERADDIGINNAWERVTLVGEAPDVVVQGLAGLLLVVLEVPRIARAYVCALKVADEHFPEV